jgi:hypothetical protein
MEMSVNVLLHSQFRRINFIVVESICKSYLAIPISSPLLDSPVRPSQPERAHCQHQKYHQQQQTGKVPPFHGYPSGVLLEPSLHHQHTCGVIKKHDKP